MSSISTYDELPPYEPRTVSEAGLIIADEPDDESSIILSNESSEDGLSDYSSNGYSSDGYIGDLSSVGGGDSDIVSGSDRPRTQRGSVAHHEGELFVFCYEDIGDSSTMDLDNGSHSLEEYVQNDDDNVIRLTREEYRDKWIATLLKLEAEGRVADYASSNDDNAHREMFSESEAEVDDLLEDAVLSEMGETATTDEGCNENHSQFHVPGAYHNKEAVVSSASLNNDETSSISSDSLCDSYEADESLAYAPTTSHSDQRLGYPLSAEREKDQEDIHMNSPVVPSIQPPTPAKHNSPSSDPQLVSRYSSPSSRHQPYYRYVPPSAWNGPKFGDMTYALLPPHMEYLENAGNRWSYSNTGAWSILGYAAWPLLSPSFLITMNGVGDLRSGKLKQHLQELAAKKAAVEGHALVEDEVNAGRKRKRPKENVPRRQSIPAHLMEPRSKFSLPATATLGSSQPSLPSTVLQPSGGSQDRGRKGREEFIANSIKSATGGTTGRSKSLGHQGQNGRRVTPPRPSEEAQEQDNDTDLDMDGSESESSDSDDEEDYDHDTSGKKKHLRQLVRDMYDTELGTTSHKAVLDMLEELAAVRGDQRDQRGPKRRKTNRKSSPPLSWDQDEPYICKEGPDHREKRRIALSGYVRHLIYKFLKRDGPKSLLPHGPPPEVAAPTPAAFFIKWDASEKHLFNATAVRIIAKQVVKDWPAIFDDLYEVIEVASLHVKYLRTVYRRQYDPIFIAKEPARRLRINADTRKRTTYQHRVKIINAVPALQKHGRLIEALGVEGTSSDEEDPTRKGTFLIKRRKQLSPKVNHLKSQLDQAFAIRFKGPGSRGNQVPRRVDTGLLSKRKFNIHGLPASCMDPGWLMTLTDVQKEIFSFRDIEYNFSFPKELLKSPE